MKKIIRLTESELISLVKRVINESDPKVGTGKKPEGSDRRLYTDENPSDTVSVKFKTKQDIVDTLNKESFKSKSHARQSQIINLIHQRLRVALERAKDPEVKKRLRTAFEYIELKKEASKRKTEESESLIQETMTVYRIGEIPYDEDSFFVTPDYKTWLKFYPSEEIHKITTNKLYLPLRKKSFSSFDELRSKYENGEFTEDDVVYINPEESGIQHFEQYEIKPDDIIDLEQIELNEDESLHKWFSRKGAKGKSINCNNPKGFSQKAHCDSKDKKNEMKEEELTEKCWAGYTQKGMKTMFGKKYPNCVKKTK